VDEVSCSVILDTSRIIPAEDIALLENPHE